MKRATHLMLGAAVALPIAVSLSPGLAVGTVWWGMVGGGFPDWFDLRSELRKPLRLRHRGASHGIAFGAVLTAGLWLLLQIVAGMPFSLGGREFSLSAGAIQPWTVAFALGFLSHILSDAWTYAGVRPFLPFSAVRIWIVPKLLRGRSSGPLDTFVRFLALLAILAGVVAYAVARV